MIQDGHTFEQRYQRFLFELKANRFPNASSLANLCNCSRNTAQRTIYRIRDEYYVPLDYDPAEKGYFLTDKSYVPPVALPPGKDELTALLFAREVVKSLDAEDLKVHLDTLWAQFAARNPAIARDLEPLAEIFSCESTVVADIADRGVLDYVAAACAGESVRITYKSPWRHTEAHTYEGRILRVHFSDGNLYVLFAESGGRELVLNTSFILNFEVLSYSVPIAGKKNASANSDNWLDGFGVWAGQELTEIEVQIRSPAAQYYASQRWHEAQVDSWDGDILVRRFPGIVSPEVVRRVLSLGQYVVGVRPPSLLKQVVLDAEALVTKLRVSLD